MSFPQPHESSESVGSLDGHGAGDHDEPYRFGWRPRVGTPYPFNTRQYGRLLVLRGRVRERLEEHFDLTHRRNGSDGSLCGPTQ